MADPVAGLICLACWAGVSWAMRASTQRERRAAAATPPPPVAPPAPPPAADQDSVIPPVLQDGRVTTVRWTRAGELIGRRMWGLCVWWEDGELRLTSIAAPCAWDGPVHRAHLTPGVERPYPGFKEVGSAGVYAFKPEAAEWMDRECRTLGLVTGHVALSGRVVEHELGYRAERAVIRDLRLEPVALHALGSDRAVRAAVAALERRYQVDVAVSEFRLTAIEEPPPPDLVRYYSIMRTARESWILA